METENYENEEQLYRDYESVRKSGVVNMFDARTVGVLSGLTRKEIVFVMKNYSRLHDKYEPGAQK